MKGALEERLRERASELGFQRIAFSAAGRAPRAEAFLRWLSRGFAGEMTYLEREPEARADVTRRSPWARTIVSASLPYGVEDRAEARGILGLISRYAVGRDYHGVVKAKLEALAGFLRSEAGGRAEVRALVDTSALLERDHAARGGLGWTGKNAMAIDPAHGSYVFLGEILTDVVLEPGAAMEDLCGGCTRCIEACPTGAIVGPRVVDARRCISYLTIELRGAVPLSLRRPMGDHLFGCDVCQEVCPWNRAAPEAVEPALLPDASLENVGLKQAIAMTPESFAGRFRGSALSRAKRSGFVRSALIVAANRGDGEALRAGGALLDDPDPMLRETAVWALAQDGSPGERRLAARRADQEPDPAVRARMQDALEHDGGGEVSRGHGSREAGR